MEQVVVTEQGPAPWVRWLAIPAAFLIIIAAALAIQTESRTDFLDRVRFEQAQQEAFENVDNSRILLQTEDGVVELSLDGESVMAREGEGGSIVTLESDPNGEFVGFRVTEDGTFEPVRAGEDTTGDTLIVPNTEGGFDLVLPDGTRTTLETDGNGELRAFDENGDEVALSRNSDGGYNLGEGITAQGSDLEFDDQAEFDDEPDFGPESSGPNWNNIVVIFLALLGLALAAWWFFAMRPKQTTFVPPTTTPTGPTFGRSPSAWEMFEAYLSELAAHPDPTQAIRHAYAYAEQGMGRLPAREPEQTPQEWYQTVAARDPEVARLLAPLTERYSAIRFGNHVASDTERHAALQELRLIVHGALADDLAPA